MKQDMSAVKELSDKIFHDLEVKGSEFAVKKDADPYFNNLPANLSRANVEEVHEYDDLFKAAGVDAATRCMINAMKDNSELKLMTGQISTVGKDHIAVTAERDRVFRIPGKPDETVTKPIHITQTMHTQGIRTVGTMAKVHETLAELAADAFK